MAKFGESFLKRQSVVEKFANLFDLSPTDIKGKHSITDAVANAAIQYKYNFQQNSSEIKQKVINIEEAKNIKYVIIGYDIDMGKKDKERGIITKQFPVGTIKLSKDFSSEMIINCLPEIYTDEEGHIWKKQV